MKVLVGSTNSVKIEAVSKAFEGVFPKQFWEIKGHKVASGVSEQPLTESETIAGARNRAKNLRKIEMADYYVGIEGGLYKSGNQWMECGWVIILDNYGNEGIAASAKIMISDQIYKLLNDGNKTLNDACEKYFKVQNAGQQMGYFGLMTNGLVDRTRAYVDATAFALARFAHPYVFED